MPVEATVALAPSVQREVEVGRVEGRLPLDEGHDPDEDAQARLDRAVVVAGRAYMPEGSEPLDDS